MMKIGIFQVFDLGQREIAYCIVDASHNLSCESVVNFVLLKQYLLKHVWQIHILQKYIDAIFPMVNKLIQNSQRFTSNLPISEKNHLQKLISDLFNCNLHGQKLIFLKNNRQSIENRKINKLFPHFHDRKTKSHQNCFFICFHSNNMNTSNFTYFTIIVKLNFLKQVQFSNMNEQ